MEGCLPPGAVRLRVVQRQGRTRLADLYQRAPMRVALPEPEVGEPLHAVLINTSGGLVGGDRCHVEVHADAGTDLLVLPQAAEKVYRSTGADCTLENTLAVGENAFLEWLPQDTILFQGARLERHTQVTLASGARLLAGEILVFGRAAHGESLTRGLLRENWTVLQDQRLLWADRLRLEEDLAIALHHPAALDGARAAATLLWAGPPGDDTLEVVRSWLLAREPKHAPDWRAAAGMINGLLLVRWLAWDPAALRRAYGQLWQELRARAGRPARLPPLWSL
ncbi:MAG: urease accessory protein UreD [Magnetococcus sp. WYHC-3]